MEPSHEIMIPQAPNILNSTLQEATSIVKNKQWSWNHRIPHYGGRAAIKDPNSKEPNIFGKQEHVIPLEEVVQKVAASTYNYPSCTEELAYFWILYYSGMRGSECGELRCSQGTLFPNEIQPTHFVINTPRKKRSATPEPTRLRLTWVGVDKIVALWQKRRVFRATIKPLIRFHTPVRNGKSIRSVIPTKDVWLFLNVSDSKGNIIVKNILGQQFYRHFLRLNRCTEIGDMEGASIVQIKSFSGIKSTRIIENNYLGTSKKAQERTENEMDKLQPKSSNIAPSSDNQTSS